ncbi:conserved hypothetical protein [Vibrio crassostreae]|nr:conserved hypothetical protein [Vibrio crassostreae]
MSIRKVNNLTTLHIPNIKNSDYEFNRFGVAAFKGIVSVFKFTIATACFTQWKGVAAIIYDSIREKFSSSEKGVYCFIVSPCWQKDTRIVRHFGLGRALSKDYEVGPLNLLFEKEIVSGAEVIFYGVVKLTSANCTAIFNLISTYQSGILLSSSGPESKSFGLLIEELTKLIATKSRSSSFNLDIVKAVELITTKGEQALYPYAWEETGEYHLDIFEQRQNVEVE